MFFLFRRKARDATLNVLDLFNEDESDRTARVSPEARSDQNHDHLAGNLVDFYLQQNSLVECSSATVPIKEKKKPKKKKKNNRRRVSIKPSISIDLIHCIILVGL